MLIAIEGADGTGKSTLTKTLAKCIQAVPYATPPQKYLNFRERVDKDASPQAHYAFYRDGIFDASQEISVLLQQNKTVVTDRYWLSTYTYHRIMGVQVAKDDFASVIQPSLTVILTLNDDLQIARMLNRGLSAGDRRMLGQQQQLKVAFLQDVFALDIPFISIDTGMFAPEACATIVSAAISTLHCL